MNSLLGQLARFVLVSRDAPALARFYAEAFGADVSAGEREVELTLGPSRVTIEHRPDAAPYPSDVAGWDPLFQHFAVVVDDMGAAYAHLRTLNGWSPISADGPVTLPASSGGVTAFKFRDPDGHPLEFLAFPPGGLPETWAASCASGPCRGIDHSAISVFDTARSVAFYERMGLAVTARSLNTGDEQAQLDAVANPIVEVTGLAPEVSTPHLELLCYRGEYSRRVDTADSVAATRLVWQVTNEALPKGLGSTFRDPDGHLMEFAP